MMKRMVVQQVLVAVSIVALSVLSSGCAGVLLAGAAGAGAVVYIQGDAESTESYPLNRVWDASLKTVSDMEFSLSKQEKDGLTGHISAKGADGKSIDIYMKRLGESSTKISVRVDLMEKEMAEQVMDKIRGNL